MRSFASAFVADKSNGTDDSNIIGLSSVMREKILKMFFFSQRPDLFFDVTNNRSSQNVYETMRVQFIFTIITNHQVGISLIDRLSSD